MKYKQNIYSVNIKDKVGNTQEVLFNSFPSALQFCYDIWIKDKTKAIRYIEIIYWDDKRKGTVKWSKERYE